jgi:hypothetical protein
MKDELFSNVKFGNPTCPYCGVTYSMIERHDCIFSADAKLKAEKERADKAEKELKIAKMTLRDQFAMAAMQGLTSNSEYSISRADAEKHGSGEAVTAYYAYAQADAMMEARNK